MANQTNSLSHTKWMCKDHKTVIDTIIPQSKDFEDFLKRLEAADYEVKRGKYISVRAPGNEPQLQKEIPLLKAIAELIIINSSEII